MNWGKPDFDSRSAAQQQIDREAPALRDRLKSEGKLYMWPHNELVAPGYPPDEVKKFCVVSEGSSNEICPLHGQSLLS
ncbi:hypothetical protein STASHLEY_00780 [Brevundimonas phage vB_BpoS-StAshley]|nr:hypothetical protein STASHLEY_00780 [Brevundimonas phage vB_BpoS-StAshley]